MVVQVLVVGERLVVQDLDFPAEGGDIEGRASAAIEAPDLCPRFTLALIEGIQ